MLFKVTRYALTSSTVEVEAESWEDAAWQGSGPKDFKRVEDEEGHVFFDDRPETRLKELRKDLSTLAGKWWARRLCEEK